jgi:DMSO/TMAO reductase YedYZ molybdopterin-dependent catalytic subunit
MFRDRRASMKINPIIILAVVAVIAGGAYILMRPTAEEPTAPETFEPTIPEFTVELIGAEGETATLTEAEAAELTQIEMTGGLKTSAGSIQGPYTYKGVPLGEALELVGGATDENSLRVTASDGYAMVFTWEEINGEFLTFDPATGDETEAAEPLMPVLAYMQEDEPLYEDTGPIRLVVLGEEGLISEGHFWIKQVATIEVVPAVREYTLLLNGTLIEEMDRATFESGVNCPDTTPLHQGVYEDDEGNIWTGMQLWLLVGRIDDELSHVPGAYNRELADANSYTVQVIAADGYTAEFNASYVKFNQDIILCNEMNGEQLPETYAPLRLMGEALTRKQMIRNVAEIRLLYTDATAEGEEGGETGGTPTVEPSGLPEFELSLVGEITDTVDKDRLLSALPCSEMQHYYTYTDGDGNEWTGVPVWLLVGLVDDDNGHGEDAFNRDLAAQGYEVSFIASDDYHKELDSTLIAENNEILVAYLVNGEPLPEDKAPLRVVGEGLSSGQMVSMLVRIEIIFPQ